MELTNRQEELLNCYLDGHRVKTLIGCKKDKYYLMQVYKGVYHDLEITPEEKLFMDQLHENSMNPTAAERTFTGYVYSR